MTLHYPAPLVPPEIDLKGFSSFMLDVDRLFASELMAIGTPEECWAALLLWCRAWKQTPPASLPNDDKILAAFSKSGGRWPKIKTIALRGFILCSDGRLYHKVLAQEAVKAWKKREAYRNDQERLKRWRANEKLERDKNRNANGNGSGNDIETRFNGHSAFPVPVPVPVPVKKDAYQEKERNRIELLERSTEWEN